MYTFGAPVAYYTPPNQEYNDAMDAYLRGAIPQITRAPQSESPVARLQAWSSGAQQLGQSVIEADRQRNEQARQKAQQDAYNRAVGQVAASGFSLPQELANPGMTPSINSYYSRVSSERAKQQADAARNAAMLQSYQNLALQSGVGTLPPEIASTNNQWVWKAYIDDQVKRINEARMREAIVGQRSGQLAVNNLSGVADNALQYMSSEDFNRLIQNRTGAQRTLAEAAGYGANAPAWLIDSLNPTAAQAYSWPAMRTAGQDRAYTMTSRDLDLEKQRQDLQMQQLQMEMQGYQNRQAAGTVNANQDAYTRGAAEINARFAANNRLGSAEHLAALDKLKRELQVVGNPYGEFNR